jgi:CHAT domain-containing protein
MFDRRKGLSGLLFEHPDDADKPVNRRMQLVEAEEIAARVQGHGIPVVFLDACRTAEVKFDPTASVAAKLLEQGVSSVVAMSHSVLVEASRRFVLAFYRGLAEGQRVGEAMLRAQKALKEDTWRGKIMGAGELRLQDWFLPVLYQEPADPQLFARLPSETAQKLEKQRREHALGDLPETPAHTFVGRSYELLTLERLLAKAPYVVVRARRRSRSSWRAGWCAPAASGVQPS